MKLVSDQYSKAWDPNVSRAQVEDALTKTNDKITGILNAADETAVGPLAALKERKLTGKVWMGSQNGIAEICRAILLGEYTLSVFSQYDIGAKVAADLAIKLANGQTVTSPLKFDVGHGKTVPFFKVPVMEIRRNTLVPVSQGVQPRLRRRETGVCRRSEVEMAGRRSRAARPQELVTAAAPAWRSLQAAPRNPPAAVEQTERRKTTGYSIAAEAQTWRLLVLVAFTAGIWVFFHFKTDHIFISPRNLSNLTVQTSITALVALGTTWVLIVRQIDLACGSLLSLAGVVAVKLQVAAGWSVSQAIAVTLALGMAIGLVHGLVIVRLGVPSFIMTLAGLMYLSGLAFIVSDGFVLSGTGQSFYKIANNSLSHSVTVSLGVALAVLVAAGALLVVVRRRQEIVCGRPSHPSARDGGGRAHRRPRSSGCSSGATRRSTGCRTSSPCSASRRW